MSELDPTLPCQCTKCGHKFDDGENFIFHIVDKHLQEAVIQLIYFNPQAREYIKELFIKNV